MRKQRVANHFQPASRAGFIRWKKNALSGTKARWVTTTWKKVIASRSISPMGIHIVC